MELRMYGLVNYQLTGIQMGIQFLHSTIEYSQSVKRKGGDVLNHYNDWADNYKTVILLNGGTTNNNPDRLGSLNKHLQTLKENKIFCTEFSEIDIGDQLTSFTFLVDERVFNKKKYPDFDDWLDISKIDPVEFERIQFPFNSSVNSTSFASKLIQINHPEYLEWVKFVGGQKNVFLRNFLKQFNLA